MKEAYIPIILGITLIILGVAVAFSYRDIKSEVDVFGECIRRYSKIPVRRILDIGCGSAPIWKSWRAEDTSTWVIAKIHDR